MQKSAIKGDKNSKETFKKVPEKGEKSSFAKIVPKKHLPKNITGYQRDLMKMRADHATSLHCDIFTIITNKHSSHRILSQTLLWSGPMRGGRSALKIILKTNNCTRYKKSRIFRTKSNIVLIVSVTLIFSYYEILEMLPLDYN